MRIGRKETQFIKSSKFMNLQTIEAKIKKNQYKCHEEMMYDLRKIKHLITVESKESSDIENIEQYIEKVSSICEDINECPHCVYNYLFEPHGRASLCPQSHRPVLFDQTDGLKDTHKNFLDTINKLPKLFPGKLIEVSCDDALVHFFGSKKQFRW